MTFRNKEVIGLVPARGNSKGLPRKNLRQICGRPLVAHSIQAGLDSGIIDKVILSSEDEEILEIGRAMGVIIHQRSPSAANDYATANDVIRDILNGFSRNFIEQNPFLVYLQPTSPLREARHIDGAFGVLGMSQEEMCVSVCEVDKSPFKSFILNESGRIQSLFDEHLTNANRQNLPKVYCPNGAIYIFSVGKFIQNGGIPSNGSVPYIMSRRDSVDIDSEEDLLEVEKRCLGK